MNISHLIMNRLVLGLPLIVKPSDYQYGGCEFMHAKLSLTIIQYGCMVLLIGQHFNCVGKLKLYQLLVEMVDKPENW